MIFVQWRIEHVIFVHVSDHEARRALLRSEKSIPNAEWACDLEKLMNDPQIERQPAGRCMLKYGFAY
jgi:hypothetical protein